MTKLSPIMRLATWLVAALVLAGTTTIGVVVVGTQIGFYRTRMALQVVDFGPLPIPAIDLPVFTPLATEGVAWMCTAMAVILVAANKTAGLWTRSMWLFSAIAAFVNTFRAAWLEHDLLGGIVTGGLSIAGPYTVHLFVVWVRHVRTGRTLDQVRADIEIRWVVWAHRARTVASFTLDHLVHPVTGVRTMWVWRAFRGITYRQAWIISSKPVRERILKHYRSTDGDIPSVEEQWLTDLFDDRSLHTLMHRWTRDTLGGCEPGSTSGNTLTLTPDEHPTEPRLNTPKPPSPHRDTQRAPRASQPSVSSVQAGVSKQEQVVREYWRRRESGLPVEGVNMSELARELFDDPATRPTVSKTWNACLRGQYPNPNGGEQ